MDRERWKQSIRERRRARRADADRLFALDDRALRDPRNPHVVIRTTPRCDEALEDEEWQEQWAAYERAFRALYDEAEADGRRFSLVFEVTVRNLPMSYVLSKARLLKALKPRTERVLVASAIVVPNATVRTMLERLLTFTYEVVRPNRFCEDCAAATAFVGGVRAGELAE